MESRISTFQFKLKHLKDLEAVWSLSEQHPVDNSAIFIISGCTDQTRLSALRVHPGLHQGPMHLTYRPGASCGQDHLRNREPWPGAGGCGDRHDALPQGRGYINFGNILRYLDFMDATLTCKESQVAVSTWTCSQPAAASSDQFPGEILTSTVLQ